MVFLFRCELAHCARTGKLKQLVLQPHSWQDLSLPAPSRAIPAVDPDGAEPEQRAWMRYPWLVPLHAVKLSWTFRSPDRMFDAMSSSSSLLLGPGTGHDVLGDASHSVPSPKTVYRWELRFNMITMLWQRRLLRQSHTAYRHISCDMSPQAGYHFCAHVRR